MPVFERPEAEIYCEVHGSGYPLLLVAPGALRSKLAFRRNRPANPDAAPPCLNPMADPAGPCTVNGIEP